MDITEGFISIIGISNDLTYKERIDPRVISSFGSREYVFPPYKNVAKKASQAGMN